MSIIEDITDFIFIDNTPEDVDIIFIPGGSFPEIVEKAADIWKEGYAPFILPSGKYSIMRGAFPGVQTKANIYSNNYQTEWEFMKDVLVKNGVDEKVIIREDEATSTYENAIYSKRITDIHKLSIQKGMICCKSFHARRSLMYYQVLYPQTKFIVCPAEVRNITRENWFTTDDGINTVMGELSRCGNQFVDIFKQLINEITSLSRSL